MHAPVSNADIQPPPAGAIIVFTALSLAPCLPFMLLAYRQAAHRATRGAFLLLGAASGSQPCGSFICLKL